MFRTVEFSHLNIPLLMFAEWNDRNTDGKLIVAAREEARGLLERLSGAPQKILGACIGRLQEDAGVPAATITGIAALSLTNWLLKLHRHKEYEYVPAAREFLGFWEHPRHRGTGVGMIMWYTAEEGYMVEIANSKNDAWCALHKTRDWLPPDRLDRISRSIADWNCPKKCEEPSQRFNGKVAELLAKASVVRKIFVSMHELVH